MTLILVYNPVPRSEPQMTTPVRIAVAGAGLAGLRHIAAVRRADETSLVAIADPAPSGKSVAQQHNIPHFDSPEAMLETVRPDGVVVATPTANHFAHASACVNAGVAALVEKPVAATSAEGKQLAALAQAKGVAILAGHYRRHNPIAARAREIVASGALGRLRLADWRCWLYKPDAYFGAAWRREPGGGPVFINLIHDVDLLRYLCGEVESVFAAESPSSRGVEAGNESRPGEQAGIEDSAAVLLRLKNGALATMSVSDSVAAPWSWELTARENPIYPATGEICACLGGDRGSLSLPDLSLWRSAGAEGWRSPMLSERPVLDFGEDPMVSQVRHFAAAVRGAESPLVSAEDATRSLELTEAIKRSATTGKVVRVGS